MKHLNKLGRLLTVLGLALLLFYGAARIHEILLSRLAIHQFEKRKPQAADAITPKAEGVSLAPLVVPAPDFLSWSKQRVMQYQDSLAVHLQPPLAILRIPRVKVEVPVLEGNDDLTLNRGVGRIKGTARIGETGNLGIAGHRDGFFRELKDIKLGDRVDLETPQGTSTYVVDHMQIVDPSEVSVLQPASTSTLTLVTCYPFHFIGNAPKRFIVHATLVSDATSSSRKSAI